MGPYILLFVLTQVFSCAERFLAVEAKKPGSLVARKNPLYREGFTSIASGVFPAGDIRFRVLRWIKRAVSLIT
jgi:hypothetical protein